MSHHEVISSDEDEGKGDMCKCCVAWLSKLSRHGFNALICREEIWNVKADSKTLAS